ncbi:MAG: tetratricopeptide repeat protein, partial [Haliea sp.]|nr:tetratricopeptide repeat protein [Haliea sp.]
VTDVTISRQLGALGDDPAEVEITDLMLAIESRASQRPDNLHYLALLGRYQMGQGEFALAAETYDRLLRVGPEDPQALAYAAQARFLADDRSLSPLAQARAEQALAINPQQRTALGLLGMSAFERGQYRAAIAYWERLVVMEAPGSEGEQMISGVIAEARQRLGEPAPQAEVAAVTPGVTVRVAVPE